MSFRCRAYRGRRSQRAEVVHGPVGEYGFAIDELARDRTENARVVGAIAMIAHHEILALRNAARRVVRAVEIARGNILVRQFPAVHENVSGANLDGLAGKCYDALDERL